MKAMYSSSGVADQTKAGTKGVKHALIDCSILAIYLLFLQRQLLIRCKLDNGARFLP